MGIFDNMFKTKKADVQFSERFSNLFLQRVGSVNNYEDNARIYIKRGYQENPIVHSIVSTVAKNGSKAPWVCKDKRTGEIVHNNQLKMLMAMPNPDKSWMDFMQELLTQKLLTGNGFATYELGGGISSGVPQFLYTLPSEQIQIIQNDKQNGIAGYELDFAWSEANIVPASEVLHIKTPNPDYDEVGEWLFGQSPFRAARRSIQAYNTSLDTGVWFLENKGAQKILINKNDDLELSPEAQDQLKRKLRATAQGSKNSANIPIVDGDIDVLDISANADDALVLQQRVQAAKEICNVINFPIQLIGIDSSTYQNAKEAKKALWENVIIPELCEIRAGLNRWLSPLFGDHIELDFDLTQIDALQEDRLMRGKAIKEFAGMITINEARGMAGLMPLDSIGDQAGDSMYVGFTQAVVSDTEELSDVNDDEDGEA